MHSSRFPAVPQLGLARPCSGVPREGFGVFNPPPKFRSFDTAAFDCKLSEKCLVFLFQHPNCLKIAEFRTPTHQDIRKKGSKILKLPRFAVVLH